MSWLDWVTGGKDDADDNAGDWDDKTANEQGNNGKDSSDSEND